MRTFLPFVALVVACGGHAPAPAGPPHNTGAPAGPPAPVVTLKRTACMGRCPVYEVTILDDGTVRWKGEENVATIGDRTGHADAAQVQRLIDAFVAARYLELDDEGRLPQGPSCKKLPDGSMECEGVGATACSDTPHGVLTFVHGGQTHTTDDQHCGEEKTLIQLEDLVDEVAGTAAWRGGGGAP